MLIQHILFAWNLAGIPAHRQALLAGAAAFAARTGELLQLWHAQWPSQPAITADPAGTPVGKLPAGTRIHKPNTTLTIAW
ncbi:hypothetical protein [Pseudonocardia kunmingensis]|uniref:hypothetical protein n=1 Tax=Pseudonocardia kunmingensis TaxID=630975 RepID=UPI001B87151E|nr:hypothetical protein [Pseudonocardia kunmingensis]